MGGNTSQPANPIPEALFSQPWRDVPEDSQENLHFVKSYQPRNREVRHMRILLVGPVGAGKSSVINSFDSVLQNRITGRAATDSTSGESSSVTQKYAMYKISKDSGDFYSFIFNDTMGFEEGDGRGVHVEDIKLALKGHVKDGYKFNPNEPLREGDFYNPSPTLDDRVHVLVFVVPANSTYLSSEIEKKMREVRLAASEMEIPQLAILTKVDEVCPEVEKNINNAYKSKYLKKKVNEVSPLLGIPLYSIFLMKNYHSEIKTSDDINALILVALRQMISFGEDFLNHLQD